MEALYPCLWFDNDASEAAQFYCNSFAGSITHNDGMVIDLQLFNQKIMLLNGGPMYKKNASISFLVLCNSEKEIDQYWEELSQEGKILMPLQAYPWSKKNGWIRDKYGCTWQLFWEEKETPTQKIIPTLLFLHQNNGKANEAIDFYTSIFPKSSVKSILRYGEGIGDETHEIPENIQHAHFVINGTSIMCMDSSIDHPFNFDEGISLVVRTENQEETDFLWGKLVENGQELQCGWLKDQYGVCWQIIPKKLVELLGNKDPEIANRAIEAMMKMKKIIIKDLDKG